MKRIAIITGLIALLISVSVYAYTISNEPKVTYQTHVISGEVNSPKSIASKVMQEAESIKSQGYRLVDVSMTSIPFGQNDYRIVYVATFERVSP
ncbi:hypothetical protein DSL64_05055 [Dyadobacter luteus]|uniref:DUF4177 domain-containing protein n=1 Tax=Dyadobacter luteus TaxID=2259619 RepID=A0A3D8YGW5_9BACT|nr:hypothetical protein [Dyadobacter luteus]REA63794.1 hypothetical protein DSL64_05055 [Dyadobacter luteus]